jgi:hypothetical protein
MDYIIAFREKGGEEMNKKILLPIMALLVLFAVAPVMAPPAAKTTYTADVDLDILSLDEEWTTEGGILHVKGVIAEGPFDSEDLGIEEATMEKKFDYTVNTNTGKGTLHGKFVLTVGTIGTLEGSFRGKITDGTHLSGTVVGHGTEGFEGVKTMGLWEGDIVGGTLIENELEAILLSPKG